MCSTTTPASWPRSTRQQSWGLSLAVLSYALEQAGSSLPARTWVVRAQVLSRSPQVFSPTAQMYQHAEADIVGA